MNYRTIFFSFFLFLLAEISSAQYYDSGQDPGKLKWLQIKNDRFRIVYPESYGTKGIEFARELDKSYSRLSELFPEKKFRIPVIIHNYTTQANGYVMWAPKRMEIYPTPEQNGIPSPTNEQLAIHELTHVLQVKSLYSGFSRAGSLLLGEHVPGLMIGMFLPMWTLEGGAVFAETYLTESGRGRSAGFQKELKALLIEKNGLYKYDKMLNGSFKNYIPDHYRYGYQMVAWSYAGTDLRLWPKVFRFTGSEPFTLNPVNISLKREAGLTKKKLFEQTFDTLKVIWKEDLKRTSAVKYSSLNPEKGNEFLNYLSPVFAGNDSIIAYRYSLYEPPAFVLIRPSQRMEEKLHMPGYINDVYLSYARGRLVWVETRPDPRWENRNYSVICIKDLNRNLYRQLTRKSRYMSASISPDGSMIAASENSIENLNSLVILNSMDGSVLTSVPAPGNASLQRPGWSADGKKVTVISLTEAGEGIMSYEIDDKRWEVLIEPARNDLQSSFLRNDSLFYISSASGTDNVYILAPDHGILQVSGSRFGANDLCVRGSGIIFSDYTSLGNDICMTYISEAKEVEKSSPKTSVFLIDKFEMKSREESGRVSVEYKPERYHKWQHLFGFHSWMPFWPDIIALSDDPSSMRPGLTLMSQNQLSTLITTIGYEYSADYRHKFHSRISWEGWYPKFISEFDYNNSPVINRMNDTTVNWTPSPVRPGFQFNNIVYLPLAFSAGTFSQYLQPSFSARYVNNYMYIKSKNVYDYGQTQLTGRLYFSNYQRQAIRDIYHRWAQIFDLTYTFSPFDRIFYGTNINLKTVFYFPGIFRNNSIRLRYEIEKQDFVKFLTFSRIHFPRGYSQTSGWYLNNPEIVSVVSGRSAFWSVDYTAPLIYPDLNISSLLYLTRIRGGLFFDQAKGTDNYFLKYRNGSLVTHSHSDGSETFSSFGTEIMADFYLLRIPYQLSAGGRAAWKSFSRAPSLEFLFTIDIYGMRIGRTGLRSSL